MLDLDNTLWGGVIGDDGPEGIELGNETPTGMAYTAFQSYLKELSGMGVLLNVCSKMREAAAKAGFERVDSVLKADDFPVLQGQLGAKVPQHRRHCRGDQYPARQPGIFG